MGLDLTIFYRGKLSGCNYDCAYCPFAKRVDSKAVLAQDAADLNKFVNWIDGQPDGRFRILFTPWGEALIRRPYQDALCRLSHMPQISRVSIQTNLSCRLNWIDDLNTETASLWCTYHPDEVSEEKFLAQCQTLSRAGISFSVGCVGTKSARPHIERLREKLPGKVYLWVNAYKDEGQNYYTDQERAVFTQIDPEFETNLKDYDSLGQPCRAGHSSVSIDGDGNVRRCHFIKDIIGNIYQGDIDAALKPQNCARQKCDCHIGYTNMEQLGLDPKFTGWAAGRIRS